MSRTAIAVCVFQLLIVMGVTPVMAGIFDKSPLESPWSELFRNVKKLNEKIRSAGGIDIHNARIENYDITQVSEFKYAK